MNSLVESIIKSKNPRSTDEAKLILREVIQSIILSGLSKSGFFNVASFYGDTALRMFYGLGRYSENLDFTLNEKDDSFSIAKYLASIKEEAKAFGLDINISKIEKSISTPIESAFAKLNTYKTFFEFKTNEGLISRMHKDEVMKVKMEVDCNPSLGFNKEIKWTDSIDYSPISTLDEASLFAGKIHAILCRNYKNSVKGRDYYDFVFYSSRRTKPNMVYLKNKLADSGKIGFDSQFDLSALRSMLKERMLLVDFEAAKKDAKRFLLEEDNLSYFNKDFFLQLVDRLN